MGRESLSIWRNMWFLFINKIATKIDKRLTVWAKEQSGNVDLHKWQGLMCQPTPKFVSTGGRLMESQENQLYMLFISSKRCVYLCAIKVSTRRIKHIPHHTSFLYDWKLHENNRNWIEIYPFKVHIEE